MVKSNEWWLTAGLEASVFVCDTTVILAYQNSLIYFCSAFIWRVMTYRDWLNSPSLFGPLLGVTWPTE